jgi:hypothetical protein
VIISVAADAKPLIDYPAGLITLGCGFIGQLRKK